MKEYIIKIDEDKKDIMGNCPLVEKPQELVRCKDCKHYRKNTRFPDTNLIMDYCALNVMAGKGEDYFCADGERKE